MSKNADRVQKHRNNGLNERQNDLYHKLRLKFGIPSTQACKMKYWSLERIQKHLKDNNIEPVESLKGADRL